MMISISVVADSNRDGHERDLGVASHEERPVESRRHWSAVKSDFTPIYVVTTVITTGDTLSAADAYIRDARGEFWRIDDSHDFARQVAVTELRHVQSGEFLRLSFSIPMESRTRQGALEEFRRAELSDDPVLLFETRSARVSGNESQWRDPETSADWRTELRRSLSGHFLDSIERMRESLFPHDPDLNAAERMAALVGYGLCEPTLRYSKLKELPPDCNFDKELGKPCDEKQRVRVSKAEKEGRLLLGY